MSNSKDDKETSLQTKNATSCPKEERTRKTEFSGISLIETNCNNFIKEKKKKKKTFKLFVSFQNKSVFIRKTKKRHLNTDNAPFAQNIQTMVEEWLNCQLSSDNKDSNKTADKETSKHW